MTKKEAEKLLELIGKAMSDLFSYQDYNKVDVEELVEAVRDEHGLNTEDEEDDSCIKCGKSGSFPDGICESCFKERNE